MLREMPSTRAVARIESPCSCAWRMAFQSVCWRGVGGRSGLTRACGAVPLTAVPFAAAGSSSLPGVPIVDEQRFCQCKRAATLSVPPSPSEDAAAPVWRPGTPLART